MNFETKIPCPNVPVVRLCRSAHQRARVNDDRVWARGEKGPGNKVGGLRLARLTREGLGRDRYETKMATLENINPRVFEKRKERIVLPEEEDDNVADKIDEREVFGILSVQNGCLRFSKLSLMREEHCQHCWGLPTSMHCLSIFLFQRFEKSAYDYSRLKQVQTGKVIHMRKIFCFRNSRIGRLLYLQSRTVILVLFRFLKHTRNTKSNPQAQKQNEAGIKRPLVRCERAGLMAPIRFP